MSPTHDIQAKSLIKLYAYLNVKYASEKGEQQRWILDSHYVRKDSREGLKK